MKTRCPLLAKYFISQAVGNNAPQWQIDICLNCPASECVETLKKGKQPTPEDMLKLTSYTIPFSYYSLYSIPCSHCHATDAWQIRGKDEEGTEYIECIHCGYLIYNQSPLNNKVGGGIGHWGSYKKKEIE